MLIVRLSREERVALAFSAMKSLDRNDAILTVEAAIDEGAGPPIPPLFSFIDEAAFWADMAHPEELEAYCLACFNAMSRTRQVAFLDHLQGRHAS